MPLASLRHIAAALAAATATAIAVLAGAESAAAQMPTFYMEPSRLPRLGTIDERYQSYNVEMVEVTGGEFWKPYVPSASALSSRGAASRSAPAGRNSDLFEYRAP